MTISEQAINTVAMSIIEKKLREWLSVRVPEGIMRVNGKLAKPDMLLVDVMGLKIIVEAKRGFEKIAEAREKCRERINEGLADICFAIAYHDDVARARSLEEVEEKIKSLKHRVEILTPTKSYELGCIFLEELAILMNKYMIYEEVVSREVVEEIAEELKEQLNEIEKLDPQLLNNLASFARDYLRLHGGIQNEEEIEEEEEESYE